MKQRGKKEIATEESLPSFFFDRKEKINSELY